MKTEIKVPAMGESITEATVGSLLKESGSHVAVDEEIIELETDKVNQVLYAPQGGTIHFTVAVDDVVEIGQVIAYVDGNGQVAPSPTKKAEAPKELAPTPTTSPKTSGGALMDKDAFLADLRAPKVEAAAPKAVQVEGPRESRQRMPKIRQTIAKRLVEAQQTTAMLTTFNEVDMSAVMNMRKEHQEDFLAKHGVKLGFMSFFVKAAVSALKAQPGLNSYIDGTDVVHREYYDIGIAVGTERGLVVPVLRGCEALSFPGIEKEILGFAKKAREGSISLDDLQGGGFTITNGGIYGSLLSTPILNPPQSGILGMHKIQKRPMVVGDAIVVRPMMYLALSYDHRIVDGKEAVTFLVHIKDCLENPSRLMLEI